MTQKMYDDFLEESRADLAAGRRRVVRTCYTCPFCADLDNEEKEPSGNPRVKCGHLATWAPPEPLVVKIGQHGRIPPECPLRVQPTLVFLDPDEER